MLEIISLDNKKRWNESICSMNRYDFYHLAEYQQLDHTGTPLLLHFQNKRDAFALPLILRPVEKTEYYDITSVYGYCGPLSGKESPTIESIREFHAALLRFFSENQIISVFARLHPLFINQEKILAGLGEVFPENLTVAIDLTLPEIERKRQYARSMRNHINRLEKKGLTVIKASNKEEVDTFIRIYEETMHRVKATGMYFFPSEYFYRLLDDLKARIFLAVYENQIISGSLCTFCDGIMQAHLNATRSDFLYLSPLKLVIDKACSEGIKNRMKILHLGGGLSGKNDSLFDFKSRFSKQYFRFKTWKYIHNPEIYDQLVYKKHFDNHQKTSFFPLYRLSP